MDSTLALGAFRIARDAGGEAVREGEPRRAGEASPKPPPKPRSGLCPEWLADFRIPNLLGALAGGAEGSFLCSPSSRFSGRGGGVGSLPRAWRRVGVPARRYFEKIVRLRPLFDGLPRLFSLVMILVRCVSEVLTLIWRKVATSLVAFPSPIISTCRSLGLRGSGRSSVFPW